MLFTVLLIIIKLDIRYFNLKTCKGKELKKKKGCMAISIIYLIKILSSLGEKFGKLHSRFNILKQKKMFIFVSSTI